MARLLPNYFNSLLLHSLGLFDYYLITTCSNLTGLIRAVNYKILISICSYNSNKRAQETHVLIMPPKQTQKNPSGSLNYESILIVTYGRSGSTLLQGVLNSIDGCLIRGENNNFIYQLFNSLKCIILTKQKFKGLYPNSAWYGASALDPKLFLQHIRAMLKQLLIADKPINTIAAYGFKEIRYPKIPDFFEYLWFLNQVFPKVAILFNTRNLDDVLKSDWWVKESSDEARTALTALEEKMKEYCRQNNNGFLIDYDDVIHKSDNLVRLFDFLGAEYNSGRIDQVLGTLHSYNPTQENIKRQFEN